MMLNINMDEEARIETGQSVINSVGREVSRSRGL